MDEVVMTVAEPVHEQIREEEGRQVVHLEVLLEAVVGDAAAGRGAAGVVDEHVDAPVALVQLAGELAHLVEVGEVGEEVVGADRAGDVGGALGIAPDDHHLLALRDELPRGLGADAAARPGDDDRASAHGPPV